MEQTIPWTKRVSTRLGGSSLAILVISVLFVAAAFDLLGELTGDAAALNRVGEGRRYGYKLLYMASQKISSPESERAAISDEIADTVRDLDLRYDDMLKNQLDTFDVGQADQNVVATLRGRAKVWRDEIKPIALEIARNPVTEATHEKLKSLDVSLRNLIRGIDRTMNAIAENSERNIAWHKSVRFALASLAAVVVAFVFLSGRNIAVRVRDLSKAAESIRGGDLAATVRVSGADEIAALGHAFNAMTRDLGASLETEREGRRQIEQLLAAVTTTANRLASSANEILAATTQQASGAQEQAAAVQETASTLDEVTQTSEQASERAKAVAQSAQRAMEFGAAGRKAVEESVAAMGQVKEQTESLGESILQLAEHAQSIGEIVAAVTDIAEQTNLLAVNAGIEASRAGEQASGFTYVAREIKDLADEAKKSTAQVTRILSEIQKATGRSVSAAEEGAKSVNATIATVGEAGKTIAMLAEVIAEAARAGGQIAASAEQQTSGVLQVHQAMRDIDRATSQNLASTRQMEAAAKDLSVLGTELLGLLGGTAPAGAGGGVQ